MRNDVELIRRSKKMAALQNPYKLKINIRPVKIAYFIRDEDEGSFCDIVRLACTQWGGIYHQIIPVDNKLYNLKWYKAMLEVHEPDWFILYGSDEDFDYLRIPILDFLTETFPHKHIVLKKGAAFEREDDTVHTLHAIQEQKLWDQQLRQPYLALDKFEEMSLALFGQIYSGQEEYYESQVEIAPQEIRFGSQEFWEYQFDNSSFSSILNLTSSSISVYRVESPVPSFGQDYVDVILVKSLTDLCMFWNLRALREIQSFFQQEKLRRTICLPDILLNDNESLTALFNTIKGKLFFPGRKANLDIRFYCRTEEHVEQLDVALAGNQSIESFLDEQIISNPFISREQPERAIVDRPLTFRYSRVYVPKKYVEGVWWNLPYITNLEFGQNEVRFEPPTEFYNRFNAVVSIDLECDVWKRYPKNKLIARAIKQGASFSKYGLSYQNSVSALPQFQRFRLPTERNTVELFFRASGYDARQSRVEQYSSAVMDLLGGIDKIDILASRPVYRLLDILTLKSTKKLAQRVIRELSLQDAQEEKVASLFRDMELPEELKSVPRTLIQLNSDPRIPLQNNELLELIDKLTQSQILRRGFYLQCPNCGAHEWYPLQIISEIVTCTGCSHSFVLPAKESENSRNEMQWRYRLNSIVNRAMDQDVLVAVLAVHYLRQGKQSVCHRFGLELWKDNRSVTDLDFFFVLEQEVYAGECKAGRRLGDKDIETAKLAADVGIDKFYFCTVSEFDTESVTAIDQLKDELKAAGSSIEILILTGSELFGEAD